MRFHLCVCARALLSPIITIIICCYFSLFHLFQNVRNYCNYLHTSSEREEREGDRERDRGGVTKTLNGI